MEEKTSDIRLKEKDKPPEIHNDRLSKKVKTGDDNPPFPVSMDAEAAPTVPVAQVEDDTADTQMGTPSPKKGASFKDMLLNNGQGHANPPPAEAEIHLDEDDFHYSVKEGIPAITFSDRVKGLLDQSMQYSVIIKLLGRRIRYNTLRDKLPYLWNTSGPYKVIDCVGDCFVVKFSNSQDFQMVLLNGPWMVFGHYLSVQPWTSDFSPMDHSINHVVGWVRLPMLPIRYYHKHVVRAIGDMLGQVVRVDYNTEAGERGRFARITVIIDLCKPLVSKIVVDDRTIFIEYEGLPTICYHCGLYGHLSESCPKKCTPDQAAPPQPPPPRPREEADDREISEFGAWMHAPSKFRKPSRVTKQTDDALTQRPEGTTTNRFDLLASNPDDPPTLNTDHSAHTSEPHPASSKTTNPATSTHPKQKKDGHRAPPKTNTEPKTKGNRKPPKTTTPSSPPQPTKLTKLKQPSTPQIIV